MNDVADTPVGILCGGRGTRLQEHTRTLPKPLIEIGGHPIVWHVVRLYAAQGYRRFVLLTGHLGEAIEAFVKDEQWPEGVTVECLDTGLDTPTGGRVHAARDRFAGQPFCITYADGVADVDLAEVASAHSDSGRLATMTLVRPELQFGVADVDSDGVVNGFIEKPRSDHWINGGFFVFESPVLDYLQPDSTLERDPLERLAAAGELHGYRHAGFWECLDTYKDAILLNDLWAETAPWKNWS
jgi:glucose-1-phosphate cytidylyltransferase